ncbi:hypothetical protein N0M98_04280 [Paenibacillus doosanensis]|uniref:Uncharacterized protein n=1 Tax=Paenibacillus konkukensis TaxID=2020716 RepID=A0ABY4S0Y3_9BACL|nr:MULTISPECIES: hypothetical protein [Paenibacillus]MCS7459348.1 hypothetical protein [Paenibacillus doosanensis]UQZ87142.1 hypothetical protein SK3146_06438 [Paenibacillus konkukensis]
MKNHLECEQIILQLGIPKETFELWKATCLIQHPLTNMTADTQEQEASINVTTESL